MKRRSFLQALLAVTGAAAIPLSASEPGVRSTAGSELGAPPAASPLVERRFYGYAGLWRVDVVPDDEALPRVVFPVHTRYSPADIERISRVLPQPGYQNYQDAVFRFFCTVRIDGQPEFDSVSYIQISGPHLRPLSEVE